MKRIFFYLSLLLSITTHGQVGIGTATPNSSAQLEVASTNKGFLPPRVALTATNGAGPITSPATGLLVYNTATAGSSPNNVAPGYYYNSGTTASPFWTSLDNGSTPTYIYTKKYTTQLIPSGTSTTVTDWGNYTVLNASEWNASTGVFTATKAGYYFISASITYAQSTTSSIGTEFNLQVAKYSSGVESYIATAWFFAETTSATFKPTGTAVGMVQLNVGDQLYIRAYQNSGSTQSTYSSGNNFIIQELPIKIQR
jgi:hypothetical protein